MTKQQNGKTEVYLPESNVPMYDLGDVDAALQGILTVGYDEEELRAYMTDYYLSEAAVDGQSYDLVDMYKAVFSQALTQVRSTNFVTSLELGAGFGSGTYAMASLYPELKIITSELSAQMLVRHKKEGEKHPECSDRIIRCQINADRPTFKDSCFDLVFGTAILHHVFDPLSVISDVGRMLKPNGVAIFTEPFEPGYGLLRIVYEMLLWQHKRGELELTDQQYNYLANTVRYWSMINTDNVRSIEELSNIDDKWIFPYEYFDKTARQVGFDIVNKLPIGIHLDEKRHIENLYVTHTVGNNVELPTIGLELVRLVDNCFSRQQLACMPHDGVLVLQKKA